MIYFVIKCLVQFSNIYYLQGTIIPLQPYKLLNVSNCTAVCKQCAIYYEELNNLYERLEDESKNKVCMDIVDSVSIFTCL